jgi:ADP-heptose:LPS heptosyltransferase
MNVATMRRLDLWLGIPACFLLTALRRAREIFAPRRLKAGCVERVLVVKLAEQGATVLAYPALRRAVERVGRENVYFFVFEENRFILDCLDVIPRENVIAVSSRGVLRTMASLLAGLARVRRIRVDAVADLEFFARSSAIISYLSGASIRAGLHKHHDPAPYRGDLMTHRVHYDPLLHTSRAFLLLVEALFRSSDKLPELLARPPLANQVCPQFVPLDDELAQVRGKVQREAGTCDFRPLVLLNANASDLIPLRRWPVECYVELAQRLLNRYTALHIGLTGGPEERRKLEPVLDAIASDRCFCLAGRTTLRELLVLYHLADVLVTNDSGPAHFAAITPIETITLFGPETPALFGALTERSHILWQGLPCSPCVSAYNHRVSDCRNNRCMLEIGVDDVFGKVCELLDRPKLTNPLRV